MNQIDVLRNKYINRQSEIVEFSMLWMAEANN